MVFPELHHKVKGSIEMMELREIQTGRQNHRSVVKGGFVLR